MLRTVLVILFVAASSGCASPGGQAPAATTGIEVHVKAMNTCPPNTTCGYSLHEIAGAQVFVDGRLANITDNAGRAIIHVPAGSRDICATHPDYGADTVSVPSDTNGTLEMFLQTGESCG